VSGQTIKIVFAGIGCDTVNQWLPAIREAFPSDKIDPVRSPSIAEARDAQYLRDARVVYVSAGDSAMQLVADAKRNRVADRMVFVASDKPDSMSMAESLVQTTGGLAFHWKTGVSTPSELATATRLHLQKIQRQG